MSSASTSVTVTIRRTVFWTTAERTPPSIPPARLLRYRQVFLGIISLAITQTQRDLGFLYNNGTYTTIQPAAANNTSIQITGVSGNNVVGYYQDSSGVDHGFLYNGGAYATIDFPDRHLPPHLLSTATILSATTKTAAALLTVSWTATEPTSVSIPPDRHSLRLQAFPAISLSAYMATAAESTTGSSTPLPRYPSLPVSFCSACVGVFGFVAFRVRRKIATA